MPDEFEETLIYVGGIEHKIMIMIIIIKVNMFMFLNIYYHIMKNYISIF